MRVTHKKGGHSRAQRLAIMHNIIAPKTHTIARFSGYAACGTAADRALCLGDTKRYAAYVASLPRPLACALLRTAGAYGETGLAVVASKRAPVQELEAFSAVPQGVQTYFNVKAGRLPVSVKAAAAMVQVKSGKQRR